MSSLLPFLLHGLREYGYPVLWLTIFIAAVGFPLPASLVLLAAGAFAAHDAVNIALLIGITITAASCGDHVGYFIGRRWGSKALHWLGQPRRLQLIPTRTITRSHLYFKCKGGWCENQLSTALLAAVRRTGPRQTPELRLQKCTRPFEKL